VQNSKVYGMTALLGEDLGQFGMVV